tara:strand:- start:3018 stop:3665 length:648 start_codon:yes stop_codon:yes gene_type:complete
MMESTAQTATSLRSRLDRVVGRRDEVVRRVEGCQTAIAELNNEEHLCQLVAELFRQLIDSEVNEGVQAVESLLTEGLSAVFSDQQISVRSEVGVSRGKVSVDLITTQKQADGTVSEGATIDAFGGAVTTVQSVLLRLIVVMRRGLRPVLLLDESLPAFDANYVDAMGKFLRLLCERMGVDILLVTHNPALVEASHKAYRIRRTPKGAKFDLVGGK